mmetsp:Transcript_59733/g.157501  ORF Transcript_59733/g.157501 Transcript_59733/m.157501 type:complete len:287 (-) Transcript_59733:381-1241(-)
MWPICSRHCTRETASAGLRLNAEASSSRLVTLWSLMYATNFSSIPSSSCAAVAPSPLSSTSNMSFHASNSALALASASSFAMRSASSRSASLRSRSSSRARRAASRFASFAAFGSRSCCPSPPSSSSSMAAAAAALRAAAHAVPSSRARSCRRARRDMTVVHVPSPSAGVFPPSPTATPTAVPAATACRLCGMAAAAATRGAALAGCSSFVVIAFGVISAAAGAGASAPASGCCCSSSCWLCSAVPALSAVPGETASRTPASRSAAESFASMTASPTTSRSLAASC